MWTRAFYTQKSRHSTVEILEKVKFVLCLNSLKTNNSRPILD